MVTENIKTGCDSAAIRARKTLSFILVALIMTGMTTALTWANACLVDLITAGMK